MADLCMGAAVEFDRDRPIRDNLWARAISRPIKIGPRVWLPIAWAAGYLLFLGLSVAIDHGVARTQSDSVLCKRQ
jgi:hypothetical protein